MKAICKKYILDFRIPSGTSRGILTKKETWFIILKENERIGIGECGILRGLSIDDRPDYETKLRWTCSNIHIGLEKLIEQLQDFPSIQFGLEQAFLSLKSTIPFELFPSRFTQNNAEIAINGLIWMGEKDFMLRQIKDKITQGFKCIKMKIGAIDFVTELQLLATIRENFDKDTIELRVDANGAFKPEEALVKLEKLAVYDLHSIEQPIKPKNWRVMANLCKQTPLPIALDEELIGISDVTEKREMLLTVNPQYIILKPSLIGGYKGSQEWIEIAKNLNIGWWVTSALESNIGLNAIAQWTYTLKNSMPQGLGTGSLFTNNFSSPLKVSDGKLLYQNQVTWQDNLIEDLCT
ncbi:o-succinylbenzoate synthase [Croceitalea rosinachiae]|uniref:O-succinylbenzoate synthase n=1 Tax=Croceitalea rosinachiae TaxID=3075596 RepID=A0ABU3ACV0_9FLAO|nr:o-succinylbenzoate synthase [Croceitalea sp. F388]MDT0607367.1 o-succinylbenzoate synthase [Croceitalea sp. F388]